VRSGCRSVFETTFVEHAYIEPEAGWARRVGERIEVHVSTQTPYMDRDEIALVMKLAPAQVRVVPPRAVAVRRQARHGRPAARRARRLAHRPAVACVYTRPRAWRRRPSATRRASRRSSLRRSGRLPACEVDALFDTGAYASWGRR
jgi:CO/xanthine dehydrogenase Mo-binding subunit